MAKYLYLKVTNDKYEFPLAVADSQAELAKMLGVGRDTISHGFSYKPKHGKSVYRKVLLIEEDEDFESN